MTHPVTREAIADLYDMLETMRPHGSRAEIEFSKRFLLPLGAKMDSFGNSLVRVGTVPVAWSSHVDTVHRLGGIQHIVRDEHYNVKLASTSKSNCLGADDTAGVWLMVEMIKAKVPGLYIFHRGEEVGGKGSDFISEQTKGVVKGIKCMIALDRKEYTSVITHQGSARTCSDEFGNSLIEQLGDNSKAEKYTLDKFGSFTDSANYTDIVGECTNLSVGYRSQHFKGEELSLSYLVKLRHALISMDLAKLVFKRKPGEKEVYQYTGGHYGYGEGYYDRHWDGYLGGYWEKGQWIACSRIEWDATQAAKASERFGQTDKKDDPLPIRTRVVKAAKDRTDDDDVRDFVWNNANDVSEMLLEWGFDITQLRSCIVESRIRTIQHKNKQDLLTKGTTAPPAEETHKAPL